MFGPMLPGETSRRGNVEKYQLVERIASDDVLKMVSELADRINRDYEGRSLVVIGILKGSFVFMADLVRKLSPPLKLDFVRLASYGDKSESSGLVRITKDIELSVQGHHVLVVEDIVDTGITLKWFLEYLHDRQPESVRVCALIDKLERRQVEVPLDYVGISLEKGFLVGYGLDFSEKHRNLPGIFEVCFE
jgi:hypoxanthine phosphoribosyltransferase